MCGLLPYRCKSEFEYKNFMIFTRNFKHKIYCKICYIGQNIQRILIELVRNTMNTMNHDCYPTKILCKSEMILIGFYNLKIVSFFVGRKHQGSRKKAHRTFHYFDNFDFSKKCNMFFLCINISCKILVGVQKFF